MRKKRAMQGLVVCIVFVAVIAGAVAWFLHTPAFGRLPQGERLERIKRSPHFRDGEFRNLSPTRLMTSEKNVGKRCGSLCSRNRLKDYVRTSL